MAGEFICAVMMRNLQALVMGNSSKLKDEAFTLVPSCQAVYSHRHGY